MTKKRKLYDLRPEMRVECGSVSWRGKATDTDDAIIAALVTMPESPSVLLRIHDGKKWHYLDFWAAMKIAGYTVRKTKNGYSIG